MVNMTMAFMLLYITYYNRLKKCLKIYEITLKTYNDLQTNRKLKKPMPS